MRSDRNCPLDQIDHVYYLMHLGSLQMRIDFSDPWRCMTQEFLDLVERDTLLDKMTCKTVPQRVEVNPPV